MNIPRSLRIAFAAIAILAVTLSAKSQQIAFTWDDLPAHSALPPGETRVEIGHKLIAAMKDARMPAVYGFVNGVAIEREPASAPMLKDWRDAGFQLGNHTWSHMNLNTSSLSDWETDLLKNEPTLQQYAAGGDWHWLRYPFLAEGNTPVKRAETRKFLAADGYRIASVTMSFGDYMWNEPYARCVAKNNSASIAQLESSYLQAASADADFRRAMSKALFGHDIPYVLLLHVGAFDARTAPPSPQTLPRQGLLFHHPSGGRKRPLLRQRDRPVPPRPTRQPRSRNARAWPLHAAPSDADPRRQQPLPLSPAEESRFFIYRFISGQKYCHPESRKSGAPGTGRPRVK